MKNHRTFRCFITGLIALAIFSLMSEEIFAQPATRPTELQKQLWKLDDLSRNSPTEFDPFAESLLKQFPKPEDQGEIYFTLASTNSMLGIGRADQTSRDAQQALKFLTKPSERLRMYGLWGTAVVQQRAKMLPTDADRRSAGEIYMKGLAEAAKLNLPAKAPDPPPGIDLLGEDNTFVQQQNDLVEKFREISREIDEQTSLLRETAWLYRNAPDAHAHLEEQAKTELKDQAAADTLVKLIEDAIAKQP